MWILVVEDDRDLADSLQTGLEETGHTVEVAHDGLEGEDLAMINDYDVIIMDRLMPGQEGMHLTRRLRQAGVGTPVLMLTAMVEVDDRVEALDAGADDYLTKPFAFEELFARVRALARRATVLKPSDILEVGVLRIDTRRRSITTAQGESMVLRGKEYALFELLVRRMDTIITRTVIAERVWGNTYGVSEASINITISTLRKKLKETVGASILIETVRGAGYQLVVSDENQHA